MDPSKRRRVPPPGELFEIGHGNQRAVVSESGATLRSYDVGARPVVEAFDGPEAPSIGCQGEILAPWPNRVVDGRWDWRGAAQQLSITEPGRGHALHGLVRNLAWRVVSHAADRVELDVVLLAHPGWPFPLHLSASYQVGPDGLTSTVTAVNVGRQACPYGLALHPYLAIAGGAADEVVLRIPAATWLATDDRLAPTGKQATVGTPYDLTDGAVLGSRRIDNAFTHLARLPDGGVEASMEAPDGRTTTVRGDGAVRWWQLFTGDDLPPRWRRRAIALEPMTCAPDALNSGDGLVVLEPGDGHSLTWSVRVS